MPREQNFDENAARAQSRWAVLGVVLTLLIASGWLSLMLVEFVRSERSARAFRRPPKKCR